MPAAHASAPVRCPRTVWAAHRPAPDTIARRSTRTVPSPTSVQSVRLGASAHPRGRRQPTPPPFPVCRAQRASRSHSTMNPGEWPAPARDAAHAPQPVPSCAVDSCRAAGARLRSCRECGLARTAPWTGTVPSSPNELARGLYKGRGGRFICGTVRSFLSAADRRMFSTDEVGASTPSFKPLLPRRTSRHASFSGDFRPRGDTHRLRARPPALRCTLRLSVLGGEPPMGPRRPMTNRRARCAVAGATGTCHAEWGPCRRGPPTSTLGEPPHEQVRAPCSRRRPRRRLENNRRRGRFRHGPGDRPGACEERNRRHRRPRHVLDPRSRGTTETLVPCSGQAFMKDNVVGSDRPLECETALGSFTHLGCKISQPLHAFSVVLQLAGAPTATFGQCNPDAAPTASGPRSMSGGGSTERQRSRP